MENDLNDLWKNLILRWILGEVQTKSDLTWLNRLGLDYGSVWFIDLKQKLREKNYPDSSLDPTRSESG